KQWITTFRRRPCAPGNQAGADAERECQSVDRHCEPMEYDKWLLSPARALAGCQKEGRTPRVVEAKRLRAVGRLSPPAFRARRQSEERFGRRQRLGRKCEAGPAETFIRA